MSNSTASAPATPKKGFGLIKAAVGGGIGLVTGVIGVYATAIVDKVAKPPKPVANFSVSQEGLTITCQNHASGQTGWWDFGDGTPLEPFDVNQQEVTHTYAKPGDYSVMLTVRNFLNEENNRSVPIDVRVPSAGAPGGPTVTGLTVEPVSGTSAPATYRVRFELKNATQSIIDLGNNERPEVVPANGVVEKLVVYPEPGVYPLLVYAMNGTKLDKQWKRVEVTTPPPGALAVTVDVTDSGTRVERKSGQQLVAIPVPAKPSGKFERLLAAEPHSTFAEVKLAAFKNPAVKDVAVVIMPDKKSIKVTGEWVGSVEAIRQAVGGTDLMVPVQLVQNRVATMPRTSQTVSYPLLPGSWFDMSSVSTGQKSATIPLPPPPTGGVDVYRTLTLKVVEFDPRGKAVEVLKVPELSKPADEMTGTLSNQQRLTVRWQKLANGHLQISARPASSAGIR
jgi:PKD repeat protein